MKKLLFKTVLIAAVVVMSLMTSCVSQKKILYLQKEQMSDSVTSVEYYNKRTFDYKVQPGDNLYIRVSSLDKSFNEFFNSSNTSNIGNSGGTSNSSGNAGIYLNGFTVSDEGTIDFPYAGKIYVKDLTIDEIQQKI